MASKKKSAGLLFDEVLPQAQRTARSLLSLDPQEDVPASQQALEMALGFVPGIGQAMALRDIERARRANDPAAAALAASSFIPFGRLAGLGKKAGPVMSELDVYHGSPHRFDEFDASKIGTGEGAQAYGHGIYLAESPDVAKTYKAANDPIARKAEELLRATDGNVDRAMRYAKKKVEDLEKNRDVKGFFSPVALEQNQGALNYLQQLKKGKTPQVGTMYTADLPDEMVDRMLDWDKPLSEQSQAIQDLARKVGTGKAVGPTKAKMKAFIEGNENAERGIVAKGEDLYRALSDYGGQSVEGSRALQTIGIPGIRYADAGSRGQGGTGTRNFVVFPGEEKKVKIKKRE